MPHTLLEYSKDAGVVACEVNDFLAEMHVALAATNIVELERIKGRSLVHDNVVVGASVAGKNNFIFLQIAMLEGRTVGEREIIATKAQEVLLRWITRWNIAAEISVTIEVREMQNATHKRLERIKP